tara:strand:+ start:2041 stop:2286 length:246 start_codon:yes stop_codon:yes gene_type:complete
MMFRGTMTEGTADGALPPIFCPTCTGDGTAVVVHRNGEPCPELAAMAESVLTDNGKELNININVNWQYCPHCGKGMNDATT